ncbi:hypothetical protein ACOIPX_003112, partial [Salmonella enterica]|nr:exo-alpha-sialidase [Salmonella enterica]ELV2541631.1 exo-alpha-sialidase [Salmonella enterica]HCM1651148.1 exo-alpha-sialidase [Salmonella enterica subsp. diarizonae serovar 48:i:z35]
SVENIISAKIGGYGRKKGAKYSIYNELAWDSSDRINDKFNPTDEVYYRMPQIVKLPSGTVVIFCSEMHGNADDIGQSADQQCNIVMKYSTNGGRKWSEKIVVANFGPTVSERRNKCNI